MRNLSVHTVSDIQKTHKNLAYACQHRCASVEHFSAVYCDIALGNVHCTLGGVEVGASSGEIVSRVQQHIERQNGPVAVECEIGAFTLACLVFDEKEVTEK